MLTPTTIPGEPIFPPIESVEASVSNESRFRPTKSSTSGTGRRSPGQRRSKFSKEIGDRGEEIVLDHLKKQLTDKERETLRWVAQDGGKPGWDIEYKSGGRLIGVEVKATGGSFFTSIEISANEWNAAQEKRSDYRLALVTLAKTKKPQVEFIDDPWGEAEKGKLGSCALTWRLVRLE